MQPRSSSGGSRRTTPATRTTATTSAASSSNSATAAQASAAADTSNVACQGGHHQHQQQPQQPSHATEPTRSRRRSHGTAVPCRRLQPPQYVVLLALSMLLLVLLGVPPAGALRQPHTSHTVYTPAAPTPGQRSGGQLVADLGSRQSGKGTVSTSGQQPISHGGTQPSSTSNVRDNDAVPLLDATTATARSAAGAVVTAAAATAAAGAAGAAADAAGAAAAAAVAGALRGAAAAANAAHTTSAAEAEAGALGGAGEAAAALLPPSLASSIGTSAAVQGRGQASPKPPATEPGVVFAPATSPRAAAVPSFSTSSSSTLASSASTSSSSIASSSSSSLVRSAPASTTAASISTTSKRSLLASLEPGDVTVVNDIPSHFEVLAGVVQVLRKLRVSPRVLYAGAVDAPQTLGLLTWLDQGFEGASNPIPQIDWVAIRQLGDSPMRAKVLICISAEMAPQVCQEYATRLQPALLVIWVHRADTATPTAKILRMHSSYKLIALAPHVATLANQRLRHPVSWAMPLAMYRSLQPCASLSCLSGFAVQGALRRYRSKVASGFTRNYTALWERMVELKAKHAQGQGAAGGGGDAGSRPHTSVKVYVLGKGGFRSHLGIPPEVDGDVEYLERLPYPEFWGRIHHCLALIPAFGMPVYYESRISSTIIASLLTGTPLVADQKLLDTYTFLGPEHVFLRAPDEDEVQAMYRIVAMSEQDVLARRTALERLAQQLNAQAGDAFRALLNEGGVVV